MKKAILTQRPFSISAPSLDIIFSSLLSIREEERQGKRDRRENGLIIGKKKSKDYIAIIKLIIVLNIFIFTVSNDKLFNLSSITLKIKGTGYKKIFASDCDRNYCFETRNYPSTVIINGNNESTVNHTYYLNKENNTIELIWNTEIDSCLKMFYNCSDINEINCSNFNTSKVTSMHGMFLRCYSLTSLDLSNFNTSIVIDMGVMFMNCYSLTSIDLSYFDTSLVTEMHSMFHNCFSL